MRLQIPTLVLTLGVLLAGSPRSASAAPPTANPTPAPGATSDAAPRPQEGVDDERPFVYQLQGGGPRMSGTVQYELGYGTRATRFFGEQGVEQGVRLRFQPLPYLSFSARGGLLVTPEGDPRGAGAFDVTARALRQDRHSVNLHLGAGYLYDYRGRHVARVRAGIGRQIGRLALQLGSELEIPLSGAGDEVDVMVGAAASYRVNRWYRQGLEVGVEDLEGFWEPEESEGGAKVLFGPTAYFAFLRHFEVRLNVSAAYAHLSNQVLASGDQPRWGVMGRMLLAYTFQ